MISRSAPRTYITLVCTVASIAISSASFAESWGDVFDRWYTTCNPATPREEGESLRVEVTALTKDIKAEVEESKRLKRQPFLPGDYTRQDVEFRFCWGYKNKIISREEYHEFLTSLADFRPRPSDPGITRTGDEVIDGVLDDLAKLESMGKPIPEAALVEALNPLFTRPAFYGIREESWNYFLFPLSKTRRILEQQLPNFRSTPKLRSDLGRVIELMVQLQNEVASLYGPSFSVTHHIRLYENNAQAFVDHLPPIRNRPDSEFFDSRDQTIKKIREMLRPHGLVG